MAIVVEVTLVAAEVVADVVVAEAVVVAIVVATDSVVVEAAVVVDFEQELINKATTNSRHNPIHEMFLFNFPS